MEMVTIYNQYLYLVSVSQIYCFVFLKNVLKDISIAKETPIRCII